MPKHIGNKLSAAAIRAARKPGLYGDGHGLYLQLSEFNTKAWVFRYQMRGRPRKMGLGPLYTVSLAEAREAALAARKLIREGIDPLDAKGAQRAKERLEAAKAVSFRQCAEAYVETHRSGWTNAKHAQQWSSTLATYAYPVFGDLPVAAIDIALVMKAIQPIWNIKNETANRLRGRVASVLDWATVSGFRSGDNPAAWNGRLDQLLPAPGKVQRGAHLAAVPYLEMPAFMATLRAQDGVTARALEFLVLTAARTGEVLGATWPEIDVEARQWTIRPRAPHPPF